MDQPSTWRQAAGDLTRTHLRRVRSLIPPAALVVATGFECVAASLRSLPELPALLALPGETSPAPPTGVAVLLFWVLTYALLPLQVLSLYEEIPRHQLIRHLRPLAMRWTRRCGNIPFAGFAPRVAAGTVAALGLYAIGIILYGAAGKTMAVDDLPGQAGFLAINWLLLHLLMVGVTLLTAFVAASIDGPRHHADSRHAPG